MLPEPREEPAPSLLGGTWLQGMADARRQAGGAVIARMQKHAAHTTVGVDQMANISSTSEAVEWWKDLMLEWDKLPNETSPTIKHPPYQCARDEAALLYCIARL